MRVPIEDLTNGVAHRRRYLPEILVLGCIAFTTKRGSLFSENKLGEKSLTTCSIHFCPCFHRVVNDLHEITHMKHKTPRTAFNRGGSRGFHLCLNTCKTVKRYNV